MGPVVANRRCARPDCAGRAIATLSYEYGSRTVWLDGPLEPDPSRYDLCHRHAERLRIPSGWELVDRRAAPAALAVPAPAAS